MWWYQVINTYFQGQKIGVFSPVGLPGLLQMGWLPTSLEPWEYTTRMPSSEYCHVMLWALHWTPKSWKAQFKGRLGHFQLTFYMTPAQGKTCLWNILKTQLGLLKKNLGWKLGASLWGWGAQFTCLIWYALAGRGPEELVQQEWTQQELHIEKAGCRGESGCEQGDPVSGQYVRRTTEDNSAGRRSGTWAGAREGTQGKKKKRMQKL